MWSCNTCGEQIDASSESCWNCLTPKGVKLADDFDVEEHIRLIHQGTEPSVSSHAQGNIFSKLFSTRGRANRREYILHTLLDGVVVYCAILLIFYIPIGFTQLIPNLSGASLVVSMLFMGLIILAGLWSELCVTVRRFHDLEKSGMNIFLGLIPIYNVYQAFILVFQQGTDGRNRYGPRSY